MGYPELESYHAFLSSGFWEFLESAEDRVHNPDKLVSLEGDREAARQLFSKNDLDLWTWERWSKSRAVRWVEGFDGERAGKVPTFEIIAVFRRALTQSRAVILFVANRRGSRIEPWKDGRVTYGTYLELE